MKRKHHSVNFYVMVGLPGVGKSTYIKSLKEQFSNLVVISRDDLLEEFAKEHGISYHEAYNQNTYNGNPIDTKLNFNKAKACQDGKTVVVDMTNMTIAARRRAMGNAPKYYKKIAIVFEVEDQEEHKRRLDSRPNKFIPQSALEFLQSIYVNPSTDEGFDEIITYTI